jgi:hypothetical protein
MCMYTSLQKYNMRMYTTVKKKPTYMCQNITRLRRRLKTQTSECYEENLSMARGKPQQTEMTAEINSNLKYAI